MAFTLRRIYRLYATGTTKDAEAEIRKKPVRIHGGGGSGDHRTILEPFDTEIRGLKMFEG